MPSRLDLDADVPYGEDLQSREGAAAWADAADRKRPHRVSIRQAIVERIQRLPDGARILELGSGPGYLAEQVLSQCPGLATYTLFDFSEPMIAMSRVRAGAFPAARFVAGDFRDSSWPAAVPGPWDAVVSMQAVHEVRHKRHVPALYREIFGILRPSGLLVVGDRTPEDDSPRSTALFMTATEQLDAMRAAGFIEVRHITSGNAITLCEGRKPAERSVSRG
jgi:SAM-dependent methyltransferase